MNYLSEIETEFTRLRGRTSQLSPLDWNQAQEWETKGIPLRIVLSAMGDGFKKHAEQKRKGEISSIRYFIPIINQQFAEWSESQVGKSPETSQPIHRKMPFVEEENMQNSASKQSFQITDENVEILGNLATALMPEIFERQNITLPELLHATVVAVRGEILALLDDVTQKHLSSENVEIRLTDLRVRLETALIVSVSEDERAQIVKNVQAEYGKFHLMDGVQQKVLIRKLYQKFSLPELTLYAF